MFIVLLYNFEEGILKFNKILPFKKIFAVFVLIKHKTIAHLYMNCYGCYEMLYLLLLVGCFVHFITTGNEVEDSLC